jgi:hypothetical protein
MNAKNLKSYLIQQDSAKPQPNATTPALDNSAVHGAARHRHPGQRQVLASTSILCETALAMHSLTLTAKTTAMKKLCLQLLFLLVLASGARADWVEMGQTDEGTFYIDTATIIHAGPNREVWELTDLKERDEGSELSRRSRVAYDCKQGLTRVLALETYLDPMATGRAVVSVERAGLWKEVPASTAYETGFKTVCAADWPTHSAARMSAPVVR